MIIKCFCIDEYVILQITMFFYLYVDCIKEFEQQCQRTLTLLEKDLFLDKFKQLFGLVKKSLDSFSTDDSRKRSAPECLSSSTAKKMVYNSPIIINLRKEMEQGNSSLIQEKTSINRYITLISLFLKLNNSFYTSTINILS